MSLLGCAPNQALSDTSSSGNTPEVVITVNDIPFEVDFGLALVKQSVYQPAQASGAAFAAYAVWLGRVTDSITRNINPPEGLFTVPPQPPQTFDVICNAAQEEIASYIQPLGQTTDQTRIQAYASAISLCDVGKLATQEFYNQADDVRQAAATYLSNNYKLPGGS